ncbi:MAG TPA: alpha-L-rhamnosidase C-terminal domain-containing protein [Candidatus Binataceae bacterium]|nr:alpha-L-rhamnosidase C-terminal domain-containing protein [Candidatus Binataceae bacterium]
MANRGWPILWNARWIWAPSKLRRVAAVASNPVPPRETWNRFCYLRKSIDLDVVPPSVPARVTADSRFILYVNGIEAARGPARSTPARLAWTDLDLAPMLVRGPNTIAALVRFYGAPTPWWIPAPASFTLGFGSFAFEAPAIKLISDRTWKAADAPYRQDVPAPPILPQPPLEILDGALIPYGWTGAGFDDSSWDSAAELIAATFAPNRARIPVEPYSAPEAADIAPLTAIPVGFTELARRSLSSRAGDDPLTAYPAVDAHPGDDANAITYDAGAITLATPWLLVRGPAGSVADVYVGEDLRADGTAEIAPRFYASRYVLAGRESERVEGFETVGFRYLTVVTRDGATLESAGAIERRYPRSGDARFECDDLRLNKIWRVGARTLDLCSSDAFVDCPGREQRAWLGDSYIHALLSFVTNTDWRLVRRHLRICAHSARADGLLAMVAAGDFATASTTIPDYSLHWVRALARYFDYSGDSDLIDELAPVALGALGAFERYRADDGLIRGMPGWMFIDWAMTERAEVTGAVDALYAAALEDFALLAESALGDARVAAEARARALRTRSAFELLWDDRRGIYVDAADESGPRQRVSQQTNAIAIASGCAPRERWPRILDYILDESRLVVTPTISDNHAAYIAQRMDPADYGEFSPERNVVAAQPFFSHLVHDAIARAGRRDLLAARCLKWWPQIERGNNAFEEYWNARPGTGSRCHAWSATPTFDLTTHVLGVRPSKPGYAQVEIAPLFGALRHLEGAVPTPRGMIEIELDRERGGEVTLPDGVDAIVRFDDAALRGVRLGAGRHRIERA